MATHISTTVYLIQVRIVQLIERIKQHFNVNSDVL